MVQEFVRTPGKQRVTRVWRKCGSVSFVPPLRGSSLLRSLPSLMASHTLASGWATIMSHLRCWFMLPRCCFAMAVDLRFRAQLESAAFDQQLFNFLPFSVPLRLRGGFCG